MKQYDRVSIVKEQRFVICVLACVCIVQSIYISLAYRDLIRLEERCSQMAQQMEEDALTDYLQNASEPVISERPMLTLESDIPAEDPEEMPCTEEELELLAKMLYGEARGCCKAEQAACVWVVLNRVEDDRWPDSISEVIRQPNQFTGYHDENPVWPELLALAEDVVLRWAAEKDGAGQVGRTIPADYYFWCGDGTRNWFRKEFNDTATTWGWSLNSPYEEE